MLLSFGLGSGNQNIRIPIVHVGLRAEGVEINKNGFT
jgi:hypothetical protein